MPLWDSVQRSLEKASQEAARIAKMQRLRSNADGLARQISTQNNTILNKTMDLFIAGQLTQSELLPLCQELVHLQQQLNQAQSELKQLQASQATGTPAQTGAPNQYLPPGTTDPASYPPAGEGPTSTVYAPPPPEYQAYFDSTQRVTAPPPPPGLEPLTVSAIDTIMLNAGAHPPTPLPAERQRCTVCQAELQPGNAYCHNCGAPVQAMSSHSPTMRSEAMDRLHPGEQATIRGNQPGNPSLQTEPHPPDLQETVRGPIVDAPSEKAQ